MIKKIIGFVLILVIFFFAIKALTFLPQLNSLVIGPNKSPFQIGKETIDQINQIYPYANQNTTYNSNVRYGTGASYAPTGFGTVARKAILSKITLEKSYGKLIFSVENGNPITELNIWLTNTPDITNQTEYIDFGRLYKSIGVKSYFVDMKGGDVSLSEYKNVLIVDKNYKVYGKVILK
jgi:hypothetical protein